MAQTADTKTHSLRARAIGISVAHVWLANGARTRLGFFLARPTLNAPATPASQSPMEFQETLPQVPMSALCRKLAARTALLP